MRFEKARYTERFGSVRINEVQKILELDSGRANGNNAGETIAAQRIEEDVMRDLEEKTLIVIPTKNEKLKLLEGVVSGIPHDCSILIVSNSQRKDVDRFRMERDMLEQYCHFTRRKAHIIHQKEPLLAKALEEGGYKDIIDDEGLIRNGKAEGMIASIFMAMLLGKSYIGFIDADNYFPGAVWEYVKCYVAGFSMAKSPFSMVRIQWRYKPKISEGIYFRKWGRVSEITNKYMNLLISNRSGFETDIIKTGNAGEHAMSIELAELLCYASRFAVEPQELISDGDKHGVDIFQMETRNPHLHEDKGEEHLQDMLMPGLSTIYHSAICDEITKAKIALELFQQKLIGENEEPPKPQLAAPPKQINLAKFRESIADYIPMFSVLEE